MRIMICDPGFSYSTLAIAESYTDAFQRLGFEVVEYDLHKALSIAKKGLMSENRIELGNITEQACAPILNQIIQDQIDVFIMIHGYFMNPSVLLSIRKLGVKTAVILTDEPMQVDISKQWSKYYEYVFTNEKNTIGEHHNCFYLPVAVNEKIFYPRKVEDKYKSDFLIYGSFYKERLDLINENKCLRDLICKYNTILVGARKRETDFECVNKFFRENKIFYAEISEYVAGTKVSLDIIRNEFKCGLFGETNSKKIRSSYLSPRIFECYASKVYPVIYGSRLGCQAFDDLFSCDDIECTVEEIEQYLVNKNYHRKEIEEMYKECINKHTYICRAKEIIKEMNLSKSVKVFGNGNVNNNIVRSNLEKDWKKNFKYFVKNKIYESCKSIELLKAEERRETLHIVSNGPSFEKTIGILMDNHQDGNIIALNGVHSILLRRCMEFFCIMSIHPKEDLFKRCFKGKRLGIGVTFLFSTLCDRKTVKYIYDRKFDILFFNTGVDDEFKKEVFEKTKFPSLGSGFCVAYNAISAGIYMGFKKIKLYGLDFSYVDNKRYAFEEKIKMSDFDKKGMIIKGNMNDVPLITDNTLLKSRDCVLNLIEQHPEIHFEVYGEGLLFNKKLKNLVNVKV